MNELERLTQGVGSLQVRCTAIGVVKAVHFDQGVYFRSSPSSSPIPLQGPARVEVALADGGVINCSVDALEILDGQD